MTRPTDQQIEKLPVWAKDYIHNLQREREATLKKLNDFCDNSTPSAFEVEEHLCSGESVGPTIKRHFVQANSIVVKWRGVELQVSANDYGLQGPGIRLQWGGTTSCGPRRDDVAFIPMSYQSARLTSIADIINP